MRWVPAAGARPHRCAFLPQLGSHHPRGYFDSGVTFFGDRIYVSVIAVEQMAAALRMVPASAVMDRDRKIAALEADVKRLEAEAEESARFRESAQHFARGIGQPPIPPRKTGRPKGKVPA